jgi:hypothetical protein
VVASITVLRTAMVPVGASGSGGQSGGHAPPETAGDRRNYRRQKPGTTPLLPLGFGVGEVDVGGGDGDWEAPFWTKMVTVEPLAAVLLALGC